MHAIKWLYPAYDYSWLLEEVQDNLPKELDFELEAANSARCRANFASSTYGAMPGCALRPQWQPPCQPVPILRSRYGKSVHVPAIHSGICSKRVLTMEYMEGLKVTDVEGIRALGFAPHAVARLVSEAFNEMIFRFGDVHCDPHEANMMVRKDGQGRMQLVLLDHGLYRCAGRGEGGTW